MAALKQLKRVEDGKSETNFVPYLNSTIIELHINLESEGKKNGAGKQAKILT